MNIQHVLGSGELNSALWLLIFFSFIVINFFFGGGGGADLIHKGIPFPSHSFHFQEIVYDYDTFDSLIFYKIFSITEFSYVQMWVYVICKARSRGTQREILRKRPKNNNKA